MSQCDALTEQTRGNLFEVLYANDITALTKRENGEKDYCFKMHGEV